MRYFRSAFTFLLLFFLAFTGNGQGKAKLAKGDTAQTPYWIDMMMNPDANFYSTVRAFEKYCLGQGTDRVPGWKQFRRWEYINQFRVEPNGKLPAPDKVYKEYKRYKETHATDQKSYSGNWVEIGPFQLPSDPLNLDQPRGMGRINTIAFDPTDYNEQIIFAGAPSGGLWKTTNGGGSWTSLTDNVATLGVSSVLLHPSYPDSIIIGTGDRDGGDSKGMGVFISPDGGNSWNPVNNEMGNVTVGMMIRNPQNHLVILAATSKGIFRSSNGGKTWARKSPNKFDYQDIKFHPGNPDTVYATGREENECYFFRSVNGGNTWSKITNGIPGGSYRMAIGITPRKPTWVYLIQIENENYKSLLFSDDKGKTFNKKSYYPNGNTPNLMGRKCTGENNHCQGHYDLCIEVDPENESTIYVGGINIWKSANQGVDWVVLTDGDNEIPECNPPEAAIHVDQHFFIISPFTKRLFVGNDGGVYYSANGGNSWSEISSGLRIAQVYKIGQSKSTQSLTMNGFQDNGTSLSNGQQFDHLIVGDGMECFIDPTDDNCKYGEQFEGSIHRVIGNSDKIIAQIGLNGIDEKGAWVTPYTLDLNNPSTMFVGYKNVWRSNNIKSETPTWVKISEGADHLCSVIEQSAANPEIMYVAKFKQYELYNANTLKRTDNSSSANPTWTDCNVPVSQLQLFPVLSDIQCHPKYENIVYVTLAKKVYKSINKGLTWEDISGTLPDIPVNCIVYDTTKNEGLYIGNQTGVWYRDATMSDWVEFSTNLPNVDVRELEIFYDPANPANNRIKAATYGRGLWESTLIPSELVPPSAFLVDIIGQDVHITWEEPLSPYSTLTYNVYKDGVKVTSSPLPTRSYWDLNVPCGSYNYTVTSVYGNLESVQSQPVEITFPCNFSVAASGYEVPVFTPVSITAHLQTTNGAPAPNQTIIFSTNSDGYFAEPAGNTAITNNSGDAVVTYIPSSAGDHMIIATAANGATSQLPQPIVVPGQPPSAVNNITRYEYWVDDNLAGRTIVGITPTPVMQLTKSFTFNNLTEGLHTFYLRFMDGQGKFSQTNSYVFYFSTFATTSKTLVSYEYWTDDNYSAKTSATITPVQVAHITRNIPVTGLSQGMHSFNFRIKDSKGQYTQTMSKQFYYDPAYEYNKELMAYEYWFDSDYDNRVINSLSDKTVALVDEIPMENLSSGLHTFHIRFQDTQEKWSSTSSKVFYRPKDNPASNNSITTYRYFFNSDFANVQTVQVTPPVNPYNQSLTIDPAPIAYGNHTICMQYKDSRDLWSGMVKGNFAYGLLLNVKLFLEGLYDPVSEQMSGARNATGNPVFASSVADSIKIDLVNAASPHASVFSSGAYLQKDGTAQITITQNLTGSYYIVIKNRNNIETWSASPMTFSGISYSYDFTDALSRAYGNNLKPSGSKFVFFSGDRNQDGNINGTDKSDAASHAASFTTGYVASDINGDGVVDALDLVLIDNNAAAGVTKKSPP